METAEKLKNARNVMLKLHKSMLDYEREVYEGIHGPLTSGQFLNILIDDEEFAWLRKFSMLIAAIDEMFAAKDGVSADLVDVNLAKVLELVEMREDDEVFRSKYRSAIETNAAAANYHSDLQKVLSEN